MGCEQFELVRRLIQDLQITTTPGVDNTRHRDRRVGGRFTSFVHTRFSGSGHAQDAGRWSGGGRQQIRGSLGRVTLRMMNGWCVQWISQRKSQPVRSICQTQSVFFFGEEKGKSVSVASRAETHANRSSLTTSASGTLGACRPSRECGEGLRRTANQHRAPSSQPCCGHTAPEELRGRLQAGSATLAGELREGPLSSALLLPAPPLLQLVQCHLF